MKCVPLNDNVLYRQADVEPPSELHAVAMETAVRIYEFYEADPLKCIRFLQQILRVYRASPDSFTLALQVLSGSREEKKTYQLQAEEAGTSKQYQHKQRQRELEKLAKTYPKVAEILKSSLWKTR